MARFSLLWACLWCLGFVSTLVVSQNTTALKQALEKGGVQAVFPADSTYSDASGAHNRRFKTKPTVVTYPVGPEQISAAVVAGAAQGIPVVSRSGGHSYIANGVGGTDGALVIDLSKNKLISVDPNTFDVTVQTGNRLGDVALAIHAYGRAMPHGRCSFVGTGGHLGHGGWGHHSRMWGLILDVIYEVTVILPDGKIVTASESQNSDLFWAIRGSASSFGVVYQFKAKTFKEPPEASIFHYKWPSLPIKNATAAMSSFQSFAVSGIPSTLGGELFLNKGRARGQVAVEFFGGYWGSHATLNQTVKPFLSTMPTPDKSSSVLQGNWFQGLQSWVVSPLNTSTGYDFPETFYAKSVLTPQNNLLTNASIEAFMTHLATEGYDQASWYAEVELYGGSNSAINAVPADKTAFAHRDTLFNLQLYSSSFGSTTFPTSGFKFVDGMASSLVSGQPDLDWAAYIGYPDDRLENWQDRYYNSHYSRLQELKAQYDPKNTFRFPLSIELP